MKYTLLLLSTLALASCGMEVAYTTPNGAVITEVIDKKFNPKVDFSKFNWWRSDKASPFTITPAK